MLAKREYFSFRQQIIIVQTKKFSPRCVYKARERTKLLLRKSNKRKKQLFDDEICNLVMIKIISCILTNSLFI